MAICVTLYIITRLYNFYTTLQLLHDFTTFINASTVAELTVLKLS